MAQAWRSALGAGREPSADQQAAIVAPATGRHSVNAGAGTGKTSTLALRALYLIESGQVRPSQIVVVTFTKKAAAEVGSRIADTIDRASASGVPLSGEGQSVKCTTIHALAAEILREFAFESGSSAPLRAATDGEAFSIFHASFRALLDDQLGVDTRAFPVAEVNLENLERDLAKLALRLKNHGIAPAQFASRALRETDRFRRQSWGQLWSPGTGKNSGKRKELAPSAEVPPEQRAHEAERERANVAVVEALLEDFDRRLTERGAATYGDLIGRAARLLRGRPDLVSRLRARWRYVLLDESQDTSTLQLAFIDALFGGANDADAAGMMPVGDTRQAIYGFNGAHEGVMDELAAAADATHPLVVNRRSPQEIVDAGHAVLAAAGVIGPQTPKLEALAGSAGLGCVRVQSFGEAGGSIKDHVEREAGAIAREIERLVQAAAPSDVAILVRRRTHAAAYVRALNERGICAALDRRSGLFVAAEVRDALAWMSLVLDLRDRQAAVRVLQSPLCGLNDAALVALAARKDWLERFLLDDLGDGLGADSHARLARVRGMLATVLPVVTLPLRAAISRILAEVPIAASYVRSNPAMGAQAVINLRSFEELGHEFAQDRPSARLRDFVDDARRRIRYDDDPQEPELERDGVRVLTIHQAKGLEWPYVFVAASTKNQYGDAEPTDRVVHYSLGSGAFALKNDVDGRETFRWLTLTCEHDPQTGRRLAPGPLKAQREREQARVFYVAITRARRRVYITAPAAQSAAEAPYLAAVRAWAQSIEPGADLRFDLPSDCEEGSPQRAADAAAAQPVSGLPAASPNRIPVARAPVAQPAEVATYRPRVSFTAIATFAVCPRMARLRYRFLLPDLRRARPRSIVMESAAGETAADAARLGSLTHRALELWGGAVIARAPLTLDDAFSAALLDFADATPLEIARARESARHAVRALDGYEPLAVEAPFEISLGDSLVEGSIDLIARAAEGRLIVIDYKTGRTGDEQYALQLALYRRVAERRYPGRTVAGAILRLSPEGATLSFGTPLTDEELDAAVAQAGSFESDVPKVGDWCVSCAYRGSPCLASLDEAG